MKKYVVLSLLLVFTNHAFPQQNELVVQEQPNILVFMVDQLIPFYTSIYGNELVQTPNLDKLAENGVVFDKVILPNFRTTG